MAQILNHEGQHQSAIASLQKRPLVASSLAAPVGPAAMTDYLDLYES
jgi:hypothetical protein